MDIDKNTVLVSAAVVFKNHKGKGKPEWFVSEQSKGGEWEIPKVVVRKGESSVRAAIRMTGEKGSMTTRVLEEIGRAGGVATVSGRTLPQRYIYYLMLLKSSMEEPIGFSNFAWLEYAKAVRKLSSKRERAMLKVARKMLNEWRRKRRKEKEFNLRKEAGLILGK